MVIDSINLDEYFNMSLTVYASDRIWDIDTFISPTVFSQTASLFQHTNIITSDTLPKHFPAI